MIGATIVANRQKGAAMTPQQQARVALVLRAVASL